MSTPTFNILTIDDNEAIHEDYRKVLVGEENNLQPVSYTHLTLPTTPYV